MRALFTHQEPSFQRVVAIHMSQRSQRLVELTPAEKGAMPGTGSAIPRFGKESCSVAAPSRLRKANAQVVERWTRGQKQQRPTTGARVRIQVPTTVRYTCDLTEHRVCQLYFYTIDV